AQVWGDVCGRKAKLVVIGTILGILNGSTSRLSDNTRNKLATCSRSQDSPGVALKCLVIRIQRKARRFGYDPARNTDRLSSKACRSGIVAVRSSHRLPVQP